MLIGHKLLINSFKSLLKNDRLAHGYLFFGQAGVGKKLFAKALANFLENGEFDYSDEEAPIFNDAIVVWPNEKMVIGIDEARRIKEFLYMRPNLSSKRTVIIDGVEFLTTEAQNALLKITEEPPESSLLILIARTPEVLTPTLASRLQKVYFSCLKEEEVQDWLVDEFSVSRVEAVKLADESMGNPGLALKLLRDRNFLNLKKQAENFLKTSGIERREFIKELLESESFDFLGFLDMVLFVLAYQKKIDSDLWHRALELRRNLSNFPLNPKLQLMNL